jgi:hypothetical protein
MSIRRNRTPKLTAAQTREALEARYVDLHTGATIAIHKVGEFSVENFAAVNRFHRFLVDNPKFQDRCRANYARAGSWLDEHSQEHDELMAARHWTRFATSQRDIVASRNESLAKFANELLTALANLEGRVAHVFEWSDRQFAFAAERDVALHIATMADTLTDTAAKNFAVIKEYITREAMNHGGRGARSTSPTSNRMEDAVREAWFNALSRFGWQL